jgi:hypothetical protein
MSARKCFVVIQAQATARLQELGFVNERQMSGRFDASPIRLSEGSGLKSL